MTNLKQMQSKILKNSFLFLLISIIITSGVLYWALPYVKNIVTGPSQTINLVDVWKEEATFEDFKKGDIVTITTPYIDGYVAEYTTKSDYSSNETTESIYYYLAVDDRGLILKVPSEYTSYADELYDQLYDESIEFADLKYATYTGVFISTDSNVKDFAKDLLNRSYSDITVTNYNYEDYIMPYTFKVFTPSDKYFSLEMIMLYVALITLLIALLVFIKTYLSKNTYIKRLNKRFDSELELTRFENEIDSFNNDRIGKHIIISKNWLVINGLFKTNVVHLEDMAWIYQYEVKRRGITIRYLTIKTVDTNLKKFQMSENNVSACINSLHQYAPWAIYGYSKENKNYFEKKNWSNVLISLNSKKAEFKNKLSSNSQYSQ